MTKNRANELEDHNGVPGRVAQGRRAKIGRRTTCGGPVFRHSPELGASPLSIKRPRNRKLSQPETFSLGRLPLSLRSARCGAHCGGGQHRHPLLTAR